MKTKLTLAQVKSELDSLGYSIKRTINSEYVSYPKGTDSNDTGYFSDCLQDHLDTVKAYGNSANEALSNFSDFVGKEVFIITSSVVITVTLEKVVLDKRDFILMFDGGHVLVNINCTFERSGTDVLKLTYLENVVRLVLV